MSMWGTEIVLAAFGRDVTLWHKATTTLVTQLLPSNMVLSYNPLSCLCVRIETGISVAGLDPNWSQRLATYQTNVYCQWWIVIIRRSECLCWRCWGITIGNNSFSCRTSRGNQRRYCLLSVTIEGWFESCYAAKLVWREQRTCFCEWGGFLIN